MKKGDIVLTPFPFTDLSSQKNRPAVVVSKNNNGSDVILAFISSKVNNISKESFVIEKSHSDFKQTGLKIKSIVKTDKLVTIDKKIILGKFGHFSSDLLRLLDDHLRNTFGL